jgi:hypothetical protein
MPNPKQQKIWALITGFVFTFGPWILAPFFTGDIPYWQGKILDLLYFPGLLAAFAFGESIHSAKTWQLTLGNFVFYAGLTWLVLAVWEVLRRRKSK